MTRQGGTDVEAQGWVAPGFEPVKEVFAQAADFGDGGAAYAAYHRGELVVDLWGGRAGDGPWERDTRGCWMSVTKALTTLCVEMLVDRGAVDLDAPVADHWPAFGQAGKTSITVRDVLTHTAGVVGSPALSEHVSLADGTGIDDIDTIRRLLEEAEPAWEPGAKAGYHALTFGWILGEVVRAADGRSLGTFLRQEVVEPLGVPDVRLGTPVDEHDLLAPMHHMLFDDEFPDAALELWRMILEACRVPDAPSGLSMLGNGEVSVLDRLPEVFDSVPGRTAELGGTNLTGTARGVARIAAALAEPEGLDGVELVSQATHEQFREVQRRDVDEVLKVPIARATGYWRNEQLIEGRPPAYGPNPETIGHTGVGGQLVFSDPATRVGGAMVRSHHTSFPLSGLLLNNALYDCVGAQA